MSAHTPSTACQCSGNNGNCTAISVLGRRRRSTAHRPAKQLPCAPLTNTARHSAPAGGGRHTLGWFSIVSRQPASRSVACIIINHVSRAGGEQVRTVHGRALRLTCILAPLAPMIVPTTRFGTSIAHFSRPGTAINSLTADILRVVHGAVSAHRDKRAVAASATPPLLLPLLRHWKEVNACIRHSTGSAASLRSKCRTLARNATCTDTG